MEIFFKIPIKITFLQSTIKKLTINKIQGNLQFTQYTE